MSNLLIGLLGGILFGIITEKYIFTYFDTLFEVFSIKESEIATGYNLNMQVMNLELMRDYPELNNKDIPEQTNVIGFEYQPPFEEEEEYYDEDKLKSKTNIKFINKRRK